MSILGLDQRVLIVFVSINRVLYTDTGNRLLMSLHECAQCVYQTIVGRQRLSHE